MLSTESRADAGGSDIKTSWDDVELALFSAIFEKSGVESLGCPFVNPFTDTTSGLVLSI